MPVDSPLVRIHPQDSVAVALRAIPAGTSLMIEGLSLTAAQDIPQGHKIALLPHDAGDAVRKYGEPIGRASAAIAVGEHVHSHNLETALAGELEYVARPVFAEAAPIANARTWRGYRRADGSAATRNEVWILPTVGCVGMIAEQIARDAQARHARRIDGIHAFSHPHGCSQLGDDLDGTRAVLAGLAANPNAGGVLLLGLGCESNQLAALLDAVPAAARDKVRLLSSQAVGDEMAEAALLIDELVERIAGLPREDMALSDLRIGLKCGGSDGLSGLTANPLLGRMAETLSAAGGSAILTEIPEIFGAEQALLGRSTSREVFDRAAALINQFKRYYLDQGLPVSENPSPGNIAGGITTLEEKSLGAVQKAGLAPLADVIHCGQQARLSGVTLLEAPGNDAVSATALAAAGANLILFTTGRGTPLGFPVPTVKVATNHALAQAKPHWIDFDAAMVLDQNREATDAAFLDALIAFASGEPTASERMGQRAIAIWKRGVTL